MAFYRTRILPRLLDSAVSSPEADRLRKEVLAPARGRLLEIGFGTGLNAAHYPPAVTSVVGLDPNPGAAKLAQPRIAAASVPIELQLGAGERLPFPDSSFDTVVTTLVLCSVTSVEATLKEIRRVLVPGGSYLLMEHGLAPDPKLQRRQAMWNGLNKLVFGCHLNRPIARMVTDSGFEFLRSSEFFMESEPRSVGYITMGVAVPGPASG